MMKFLKTFETFSPYDDEPLTNTEKVFGKQTRLEKQFSEIVVNGLLSKDEKESMYWSTFNALKGEIKFSLNNEDKYKELMHRIVEREDPVDVVNDFCKDLDLTEEGDRLLMKLNRLKIDNRIPF